MSYSIVEENGFQYVEAGTGKTLVLLHGLFGALSNWREVLENFSRDHRVLIPLMPIYQKTKVGASVEGLAEFISSFLKFKQVESCVLLGNSLGGHVSLVYTLQNLHKVKGLVLTGSSGLYESGMGSTFPKRGSYEYIRERVEYTFYLPETATPELVDEVYDIVNDNFKALRVLQIARSAQRSNMAKDLGRIQVPTLLIWGLNDNITPPNVAHEFHKLIPNSELYFLDECGHAAMMEQAKNFNQRARAFIEKHLL